MTRMFVIALLVLLSLDACRTLPPEPPVMCHEIPARWKGMRRPDSIEGATSYVYRTEGPLRLKLHVFEPKEPREHRAALVVYFGGGWSWGTPDQLVPLARFLSTRGMVVAVADYRVLCRDDSTPFDSVSDAQYALQWMIDHASALHVDANRIAVGGESAGGQLALMTALSGSTLRPSALVLFSPGIDIAKDVDWARERFGDTVANDLIKISPLQQLQALHASLPPTLILNGDADDTTPIAQAKNFCDIANGIMANTCTLVPIAGANHGFSNPPSYPAKQSHGGEYFARVLMEVDSFLDSIGYTYDESP